MRMQKGYLIFTISLLIAVNISGQDARMTIIKGTLLNAANDEPVSYASVSVAKNGIQAMSNEQGNFVIKINGITDHDSVYISHIGFIPFSLLPVPGDTGILIIRLKARNANLPEVVVKRVDPLAVINSAIAKIPENYAAAPHQLTGFYRLDGRKGKAIVDLSEAVFKNYNPSFNSKNKQFSVINARFDQDQLAFGGAEINIGASASGLMEDDVVSQAGESGILSKEGISEHIFRYEGIVDYGGQSAYKIFFRQKEGIKKSLNDGWLYINTEDLAFLQITQYRNQQGLQYFEFGFKQRIGLAISNIHMDRLQDSGYTTYRKYGGKYYPDHIYGIARWRIVGGRRHFELNPLALQFNCLVTQIDTANVQPFSREEISRSGKLFEIKSPDINTDSTDAFWGIYNLILPMYNVDSAARVIRAHNETLNYKQAAQQMLSNCKKDNSLRIDSILSFYYRKGLFNGTALVKYRGQVIYEKGFGLANMEKNLPNNGETQFLIGPTSKQFTTMLIMQLAAENKLKVTDTVGRFLPGYVNGQVTIEQLMTHQSGIPDYLGIDNYAAKVVTDRYTPGELVEKFCSDSLEFEPGSKMVYSNSGYVILAAILEKITGKSYGDLLQERIFRPLGMTHSYFVNTTDSVHLAKGYMLDEAEIRYPKENEIGAGGITSTAEDLLLWHNALTANTILSKEQTEELFISRVKWDEWGADYGYGWMIDRLQFRSSKKHKTLYHPGTELGFYDMLVRQPDNDIFIILLNNQGDFPRFDMIDLILQELN